MKLLSAGHIWKGVLVAAVLALLAETGWAQKPPYVRLKNGTVIQGTKIRAKRDGTITVETEAGSRTFTKGQYVEAVAAQPPEIIEAQAKVKAKDYAAAITLLEQVVREYQYLGWDVQALKLLPRVEMRKGDYAAAVKAYERYFRATDKPDAESRFDYFEALMQTKQFDKLDRALNDLIAKGSRDEAAKAQLLRGDMRVAQNQLENAVLDYMRTAILFQAQKEVQPEALYKTAETLAKLRDPRAKDFYRKLVEKYPASPLAAKAKDKL